MPSKNPVLNLIQTEPAMITAAVQTVIGVIVAFGFGPTADEAGAILAVTAALLAAVPAVLARPVQVSGLTGLVSAVVTLLIAFGVHGIQPGLVTALNAAIVTVLALVLRGHLTPVVTLKKMAAAAQLVTLAASAGQVPIDTTDLARKIAAAMSVQAKRDQQRAGPVGFAGFMPAVQPDRPDM